MNSEERRSCERRRMTLRRHFSWESFIKIILGGLVGAGSLFVYVEQTGMDKGVLQSQVKANVETNTRQDKAIEKILDKMETLQRDMRDNQTLMLSKLEDIWKRLAYPGGGPR